MSRLQKYLFLSLSVMLLPSLLFAASRKGSDSLYTFEFDSLFLEAVSYRLANQDSLALERFQECHKLNPYSAAVCYELSALKFNDSSSEVDDALAYMQRAVDLDEDNYYYNLLLAKLYVEYNYLDEAVSQYKKILKNFPDRDEPMYELAILYNATGEYKKSNEIADKLVSRLGWSRDLFFLKARNHIAKNKDDVKPILKDMDAYLEKVPLDYIMWVYKGDFELESGTRDEAFASYGRSLEISPDNGAALMSLCRFYDLAGDREQTEYYLKKICASEDVNFETKEEYLRSAIYYWRQSPDANQKLEELQLSMIKSADQDYRPHLTYSRFLDYAGRKDESIDELRTAIYLEPKCMDCWTLLLKNAIEKNDEALAEKVLDDALDAIPESPLFYYYKGLLAYYDQNPDSALTLLFAADSIVSESLKDSTKGSFYKLDTASMVTMYNVVSEIYNKKGDVDLSLSFMRKAMQYAPNDLITMNNYAYYMATYNRDLEEMEKLSFKTIKAEPLNATFLDTYAYILMKLGKYKLAEFYIMQAWEYANKEDNTANAEIVEHIGDIKYFVDKPDEAVKYWQQAWDLGNQTEILSKKIKLKKYVE